MQGTKKKKKTSVFSLLNVLQSLVAIKNPGNIYTSNILQIEQVKIHIQAYMYIHNVYVCKNNYNLFYHPKWTKAIRLKD